MNRQRQPRETQPTDTNQPIRVDPLKTLKYHHDVLGELKLKVESLPNYANEISEMKQSLISLQVSSLDNHTLSELKQDLSESKNSTNTILSRLTQELSDMKSANQTMLSELNDLKSANQTMLSELNALKKASEDA
jgi:hypothetical protein